jgi:CCR4-NOT transcription complex subunit 10
MYLFLGHVYAAEALCALNRPKEAAEQLTVYLRDDNDVELPYSVENHEKAPVEKDSDGEDTVAPTVTKLTLEETQHSVSLKPEEACGVVYVDLGMTAAVQGDLEQASYMVSRGLALLPNNPRALLASVYVDLLQGKAQEAIGKLRRCRNVRFRTSSVATSR